MIYDRSLITNTILTEWQDGTGMRIFSYEKRNDFHYGISKIIGGDGILILHELYVNNRLEGEQYYDHIRYDTHIIPAP